MKNIDSSTEVVSNHPEFTAACLSAKPSSSQNYKKKTFSRNWHQAMILESNAFGTASTLLNVLEFQVTIEYESNAGAFTD